ncbi:DNA-directed RNA polymerases II, IV and V subunit 8B-like isoform X2 [Primulina tabacum]|uniref:DNA-directed RNA polymerases II, IV and V subunit 8B-like isoform X2 n=1 Tax=Primulina tabacum TaxID=48773 RepID=UPI003F5AC351
MKKFRIFSSNVENFCPSFSICITGCRAMAEFYFDEIIKVHKVDNQVVYDKVSRIIARSEVEEFYLELDVNKEIYHMLPGEKYRMVITNTLLMDGSAVTGYFPEGKQKSLADKFEYVMHGLPYKMSEVQVKTDDGNSDAKVYVVAPLC